MDKTAEEFRKAHNDRQQLIEQWEATIEQMQRRDREMDRLATVSTRLLSGLLHRLLVLAATFHLHVATF